MTLTQMVGDLERGGWRFRVENDDFHTRPPKPRPANSEEVIAELRSRKPEVVGFLHAREEAVGAMLTFHLPYLPVFASTPPPHGQLVSFSGGSATGSRAVEGLSRRLA